jgi:Bacterial toxin 44
MYKAFSQNRVPGAGGVGLWIGGIVPGGLAELINNAAVTAAWALNVKKGGPWDHKWQLDDLIGVARNSDRARATPFWIPVRSDPAPERLTYDVWSNIHYGYVGRAHNIPEELLFAAQDNGDAHDNLSVRIGFRLWRTYGFGLTKSDLNNAIVSNVAAWRASDASWPVRAGLWFGLK